MAAPAGDGRRRDQVQAVPPAVVHGPQQQPETPVGVGGAGVGDVALADGALLAQGEVLEDEAVAAEECGPQRSRRIVRIGMGRLGDGVSWQPPRPALVLYPGIRVRL